MPSQEGQPDLNHALVPLLHSLQEDELMCVTGRAPDTHSRLLRCSHDPAGGEGWILATEKEAEISWGWGHGVRESFSFPEGVRHDWLS